MAWRKQTRLRYGNMLKVAEAPKRRDRLREVLAIIQLQLGKVRKETQGG